MVTWVAAGVTGITLRAVDMVLPVEDTTTIKDSLWEEDPEDPEDTEDTEDPEDPEDTEDTDKEGVDMVKEAMATIKEAATDTASRLTVWEHFSF
jgi:hypothetical protein